MANKNNKIKPYYILIPLVVFLTGFIGSKFTDIGLSQWYWQIAKPSWTPPGSVIGLVWATIYFLTGISAFIVFGKKPKNIGSITKLFFANALLNALWSLLFFVFHFLGFAVIEAIVLDLSVLALIINIWPTSKISALFLVPYALWVAFAAFLTYSVAILN